MKLPLFAQNIPSVEEALNLDRLHYESVTTDKHTVDFWLNATKETVIGSGEPTYIPKKKSGMYYDVVTDILWQYSNIADPWEEDNYRWHYNTTSASKYNHYTLRYWRQQHQKELF